MITTEQDKSGKTIIGNTQKYGSGTITDRSDGSSSRTEKFSAGKITTDKVKHNSADLKKK